MKDNKLLYVSKTKYNNLGPECMVIVKSFYDNFNWSFTSNIKEAQVVINIVEDHFFVKIFGMEKKISINQIIISEKLDIRRIVKEHLYNELSKITSKTLPWGLLQGIRPTKLVYKLLQEVSENNNKNNSNKVSLKDYRDDIESLLLHRYLLSEKMAKLAINVAIHEEAYLPRTIEEAVNSFSVYISIPFCPSRCHYCSFPSCKLSDWESRIDDYINALFKEWDAIVPKLLKTKEISTVYIGGGTPTSLSANELKKLLTHIRETLPMNKVKELTVEAGRADTITEDKLQVLKDFNVNRISINPQTMHDKTLKIIGRNHSVGDLLQAYQLASSMGFERINMDLIIGLPNESKEDVLETIQQIKELNPSEITIHTLAIKRSSRIHENIEQYKLPNDEETKEMLDVTRHLLMNEDTYEPYYLYRQKNMVGSYENVGYYKGDQPCIYNIEIMEEVRPIIAFGAGAVTKVLTMENKIIRSENVKNVKEYVKRVEEMIERKKEAVHL